MSPKAAVPTRSSHSAVLALSSLITVPVNFYAATGAPESGLHRYTLVEKQYHAVGNSLYDKVTTGAVTADEVVTGYEDKDGVVPISKDELKAALAEGGELELLGYVHDANEQFLLATGDHYQVRPAKLKKGTSWHTNLVGERVFSLLLQGLTQLDVKALLGVVMRDGSSRKYGLLDGAGRMACVYPCDWVRAELPLPAVEAKPEELRAVQALIKRQIVPACPELLDTKAEAVRRIVELKRADPTYQVEAPKPKEVTTEDDLLALLQASMD